MLHRFLCWLHVLSELLWLKWNHRRRAASADEGATVGTAAQLGQNSISLMKFCELMDEQTEWPSDVLHHFVPALPPHSSSSSSSSITSPLSSFLLSSSLISHFLLSFLSPSSSSSSLFSLFQLIGFFFSNVSYVTSKMWQDTTTQYWFLSGIKNRSE